MVVILSDKFTITITWDTGRKIERKKFDYETKIRKKLTWDDFFNNVEFIPKNSINGRE